MSTIEYDDLYNKSQINGKYHMFTFDLINSKSMNEVVLKQELKKLRTAIINLYKKIRDIEEKTNTSILINPDLIKDELGIVSMEPIIFSDMVSITILSGSLQVEDMIMLFNEAIDEPFVTGVHMNNGYYETNEYSKGDKEYYRGYCVDKLSNMHKVRSKNG